MSYFWKTFTVLEYDAAGHFTECSCQDNTIHSNTYIQNIKVALQDRNTSTDITHTIIHGLNRYSNIPSNFSIPAHLKRCYNSQSSFGWNLFSSWLIIKEWSEQQQPHINNLHNKPPFHHLAGDTWNKYISTALIRQAYRLWSARCDEIQHNTPIPDKPKNKQNLMEQATTTAH